MKLEAKTAGLCMKEGLGEYIEILKSQPATPLRAVYAQSWDDTSRAGDVARPGQTEANCATISNNPRPCEDWMWGET
jgi:hypothetical protein